MTTAERLFAYADRYRRRHNEDPTFRQAARALRCTLDDIEDACEDAKGRGWPLDVTVAYGIPGVGVGETMSRSEWEIEVYGDLQEV